MNQGLECCHKLISYLIGLLGHFGDFLVCVRLALVFLLKKSFLELLDGVGVTSSQRHQFLLQLTDTTQLLLLHYLTTQH